MNEASIPTEHLKVCQLNQGPKTCAFLAFGEGVYFCAKGGALEKMIRGRLASGQMKAQGDNCSGPPVFIPMVGPEAAG